MPRGRGQGRAREAWQPRDRDRPPLLSPSSPLPAMPPHIARDLVPLADLEHSLYRHLYPFDLDPKQPDPAPVPPLVMAASPRHSPSSVSPPPLSHSDGSSKASSTPEARTPPPTAPAPASADDSAPRYDCQWQDCDKVFPEPEALYNHLCNDHIGRKSTGNLCLSFKWKDCSTSCAKLDHITSHLRGAYLSFLRMLPA